MHELFVTRVYQAKLKTDLKDLKKEIFQVQKADFQGQKWSEKNYAGGYTSYGSWDQLHRLSSSFQALETRLIRMFSPTLNPWITNLKKAVCLEEAYVLATERYCDRSPYRQAYHKAQQDLVTRLHPIWLADYVIENWNNEFWITKNNYYEIYKERTSS